MGDLMRKILTYIIIFLVIFVVSAVIAVVKYKEVIGNYASSTFSTICVIGIMVAGIIGAIRSVL